MCSRPLAAIVAAATLWPAAAIPLIAQNSRWGANYFPNVTLITQDGAAVHFYDDLIKGKIVAINLIYTTCTYTCPLETARLAQVQQVIGDRMGREVFFYSITIDPAHDTPAVLKAYAEKFHAGPGWLFLTGSPADIELISRKTGLYSEPNPANPDGHTPHLLVGNEVTGQWMRNSATDNPKFLARTIGDWLASWRGPRREMKSYAEATPLTLDRGEYTFKSHCAACHTIGQPERIGPDLQGVTKRRNREWLERFILAPDKMLADEDPIAKELFAKYKNVRMPNLALSPGDVAAVIEYFERQDAAAEHVTNLAGRPFPAMDAYLRIQDALSRDALGGVKDAAHIIQSRAAELGPDMQSIQSAAGRLERAVDLKSARMAFGELSDAIITYSKTSNASIGDGVHVAYCPMLRKYWLQNGVKIRNPYYGSSMLECGRINPGLPDLEK